eukprot:CAMPEP_0183310348 /NCGR_PEP_ID=MMETSP0160_2-20130417/30941_1 /TAXON_ID=2839 ORGANISM="Odontella Sinensis, Strain Grunow 1884" /NCGR_SAMPLE_ID=MMETSP0160_2 /ASSEMBLY_ACC=CAM_ASM_000250 /LENGTH=49 /DNA_ID=CAMNT_0025474585 /DNA_START=56 /DNA_END=205 /DNA_ORIENTATION=+
MVDEFGDVLRSYGAGLASDWRDLECLKRCHFDCRRGGGGGGIVSRFKLF